jgi:hypothetical protein
MKVSNAFVVILLWAATISGASAQKTGDAVANFLTACAKESAVNSDCGVDVAAANLDARANKTGACPPKISTTEISAIVQWFNVRPNTRNMPVFDGLDEALKALYPCRKSE